MLRKDYVWTPLPSLHSPSLHSTHLIHSAANDPRYSPLRDMLSILTVQEDRHSIVIEEYTVSGIAALSYWTSVKGTVRYYCYLLQCIVTLLLPVTVHGDAIVACYSAWRRYCYLLQCMATLLLPATVHGDAVVACYSALRRYCCLLHCMAALLLPVTVHDDAFVTCYSATFWF